MTRKATVELFRSDYIATALFGDLQNHARLFMDPRNFRSHSRGRPEFQTFLSALLFPRMGAIEIRSRSEWYKNARVGVTKS